MPSNLLDLYRQALLWKKGQGNLLDLLRQARSWGSANRPRSFSRGGSVRAAPLKSQTTPVKPKNKTTTKSKRRR